MNAIVSNKNKGLLDSLDIDVIKSINGEFTAEEIIQTFTNFFFNRMFLDITSIKDYNNIANIQKISMNMDVNKIIFLVDNQIMANSNYLSKLISMGIYNFANNKESLLYLYNHPNSYKDVAHIHQLSLNGNVQNNDNNKEQKKSSFFGTDSIVSSPPIQPIKNSIIIGFKNATAGAGASTLVYLLKKQLSKKHYVVAIEVDKNDFGFFNEKDMYSVSAGNLQSAINRFGTANYILLDLNRAKYDQCDKVVHLIEPSIIKLNKMMLINKGIFESIAADTIILNKSLLSPKDVSDFEFESNAHIAVNIPPLNDRADNSEILSEIIEKLGLN